MYVGKEDGCLEGIWLFGGNMDFWREYGCLEGIWLFGGNMVVWREYGCLEGIWLLARKMVVWREYGCFLAIHGQDEIGLMIRRMGRDNYNSDRCKGDACTLYRIFTQIQ